LILKGYNDYEQKTKDFGDNFKRVEVPKSLTVETNATTTAPVKQPAKTKDAATSITEEKIAERKAKFWDRFKTNLIEIFSEDEDKLM
jgi:cell division protein FtsA